MIVARFKEGEKFGFQAAAVIDLAAEGIHIDGKAEQLAPTGVSGNHDRPGRARTRRRPEPPDDVP